MKAKATTMSSPQQNHHCNVHPIESVAGFCAACLRQRLRSRSLFDDYQDARGLAFFDADDGDAISPPDQAVEAGKRPENGERRQLGAQNASFGETAVDFRDEMNVSLRRGVKNSTTGREIEERRRLGGKDAAVVEEIVDFSDESRVFLQRGTKNSTVGREIEERRQFGAKETVDFGVESGFSSMAIGREIEEMRQLGAEDVKFLKGTIDFGVELGFSSKQGKKFSKFGREIEEMRQLGVRDVSLRRDCGDGEIEEMRKLGVKDVSFGKDCGGFDNVSSFSSKLEKNPSREKIEERWQLRRNDREMKAMKDHIDVELDSSSSSQQQGQGKTFSGKDSRGFAGGFANMFGKKIQNWRRKQKLKRQCSKGEMPVEEKTEKHSRSFGDFRSEMGLDAFGRRSCDVEPRFSMEGRRMSLDGNRYSLDEPRASWDGYLFGGRSVLSRPNPMMSVVENTDADSVRRSDGLIPVEEDDRLPGGSAQTREYYLHSSSRRSRRSLDRSSSVREQPAELSELRSMFNAKVTPASGGTTEFFHSNRSGLLDQELKDWRSNLVKDDYFGSFESVVRDLNKGAGKKKSGIWSKSWNILGFLHRKNSTKESVDKNSSDSWTNQRSRSCNGKVSLDGINVGARHSFSSNVGYGSMKRSNLDINGHATKKRGEIALDRSRSARYSPCHNDNGLLRFYLTPMRNSWRNGGGSGSSRRINSHYLTKTMLGLY